MFPLKQTINKLSQLRKVKNVTSAMVFELTEPGKEGLWKPDITDTITADNTGTVVVTVDSKRIKRVLSDDNFFSAAWFGNTDIWFTSISDANTKIPTGARFKGLTVLIDISGTPTEYWWLLGIADTNLVNKQLTLSGMTTGSVPFIGTGSALSQDNLNLFWDNTNKRFGLGTNAPSSVFHIKAGTASANGAPLKFTSGTNLSTPENGALEYDGTNYFATSGGTRYTLAKTLSATATLDFPSTGAQSSSDLTVTVAGAASGDVVILGVPNSSVNANACFSCWVSAANMVTVRFNNYSSGAINPTSGSFRVSVFKY